MKVVPAILTDDRQAFKDMLETAEGFAEHIQVDIMDGRFVPSKSITIEDLKGIKCHKFTEAHLMVEDPLLWIDAFKETGVKRIIFHFEIDRDKPAIISRIRKAELSVGVAVNSDTPASEFSSLAGEVDMVLFMSVIPGFYGAEFIPEVLNKAREFKKLLPEKSVGIDGGIKPGNFQQVVSSGIDFICVGSAIFRAENPALAYKNFSSLLIK